MTTQRKPLKLSPVVSKGPLSPLENLKQSRKQLCSPETKEKLREAYQDWIKTNYPTHESAMGACAQATLNMQKEFYWLLRTRGVVSVLFSGEHLHWWLQCPILSEVIDPTAKQFEVIPFYEELPDDDPRCAYPRAKCMNCGEVFYREGGGNVCSDICETELMKFFNGE